MDEFSELGPAFVNKSRAIINADRLILDAYRVIKTSATFHDKDF